MTKKIIKKKFSKKFFKKIKRINTNKKIAKKQQKLSNLNQIEIELIIKDNLEFKENEPNIFINYIGDKNKYHIYLNNKEEEINRNYINKEDTAKKIIIKIDPEINTLKGLFKKCKSIKEIKFTKFNRNDIIDMSEMFNFCNSLTKINFIQFNTENVTDMKDMFYGCFPL